MTDTPRHSKAVEAELISDPVERARREAANALEQTAQVQALVGQHVLDGRPFKLRPSTIMQLQRAALSGISLYAGVYRPSDITIEKSKHQPPGAHLVAELIEKLCDYVNEHLAVASPIHLASYVLWRLNWIHPFTDGNGRTARAVAYLVLSVRVGMILPGTNTIQQQPPMQRLYRLRQTRRMLRQPVCLKLLPIRLPSQRRFAPQWTPCWKVK